MACSGTGSIYYALSNEQDSSYLPGTPVSLTAIAGTGSVFSGWNGAITGITSPSTITMDADQLVYACFEIIGSLYVDSTFGPTTPGWGVTRFSSINAAIAQANTGDKIYIAQGNYSETIDLSKDVDLYPGIGTSFDGIIQSMGSLFAPEGEWNVNGKYFLTGGLFTGNDLSITNLSGDLSVTMNGAFFSGSTVNFTGASNQTVTGDLAFMNLTKTGIGYLFTESSISVTGTTKITHGYFSPANGSQLVDVIFDGDGTISGTNTLFISGNIINNSTPGSGFVPSGDHAPVNTVIFNGAGDQTISGTASTQFLNIQIDKTGGILSGTTPWIAAGELTIINGNYLPASGTTTTYKLPENSTDLSLFITQAGPDFLFTITGGEDASFFHLNSANGVISYITAPDYENQTDLNKDNVYIIEITGTDGNTSNLQIIHIKVTDINETPFLSSYEGFSPANIEVEENQVSAATIQAIDPDFGNTLSYTLVDSLDSSLLQIDSQTGHLTFLNVPNFESPIDEGQNNIYQAEIAVSDGQFTIKQLLNIELMDVNDPPIFTNCAGGSGCEAEHPENAVSVLNITATDEDPATLLTYSLLQSEDADFFTLDTANGALAFKASPNFENPMDANLDNIYNLSISVTDGSLSDHLTLGVKVINVNEAPVITSSGGGTYALINVSENTLPVVNIKATDTDSDTILTYRIKPIGDYSQFSINSATGELSLKVPPNYENPGDADQDNLYEIVIQVSDGVLSDTQLIRVSISDQNDGPLITSNGGGSCASLQIAENLTYLGMQTSTDEDQTDSLSYSIVGGADINKFIVNSTTGSLSFLTSPDYEAPGDDNTDNTYEVVIQVSDGILVDVQTLSVTVTNANDLSPIIDTYNGDEVVFIELDENNLTAASIHATDADGTEPTYQLKLTADSPRFTVNAQTGDLRFIKAPDYEFPHDSDMNNLYIVTVQATDGMQFDSQQFVITINDVVGDPTATPTNTPTNTQEASPTMTQTPTPTATEIYANEITITPDSVTATTQNGITGTPTKIPTNTKTPVPLYPYSLIQTGYYGTQTAGHCQATGYAKKLTGGTGTVFIRVYLDNKQVYGFFTPKGGAFSLDLTTIPGFSFSTLHNVKLMAVLENGSPYYLLNSTTGKPGGNITCLPATATPQPTATAIPTTLPSHTSIPDTLIPGNTTPTQTLTSTYPFTTTATTTQSAIQPTITPKPLYPYNLVQYGYFGVQPSETCKTIGYAQKVSAPTGTVYIRLYVDGKLVTGKFSDKGGLISFDLLNLPGYTFTKGTNHTVKLMAILENGYPYYLINPNTKQPGGMINCK